MGFICRANMEVLGLRIKADDVHFGWTERIEDRRVTDNAPSSDEPRPLDFPTFLLSLGTSALVQLGEAPDPATGRGVAADLSAARQTIDLLAILEAKTQGNLEEAEENLLKNLLRDLRMRFLQKVSG